MHGFQKQFCTVVVIEEKCHLKQFFFRLVEGQGHRGQIKVKWSYIELVRAITCTFMHGFQNNFAQFLSSRGEVPFELFFHVG